MPTVAGAIDNGAMSVVIPASAHIQVSPTNGGRNKDLIPTDPDDLQAAAKRDTAAMKKELANHADDKFLINILNTVS